MATTTEIFNDILKRIEKDPEATKANIGGVFKFVLTGDLDESWLVDCKDVAVRQSDDDADCTYPPPSYSCPAGSFAPDVAGTWHIEVIAYDSCVGEDGTAVNYTMLTSVEAALTSEDVESTAMSCDDASWSEGSGCTVESVVSLVIEAGF